MPSRQQVVLPAAQPATVQPVRAAGADRAQLLARQYFDKAIFAFLCLFAVLLPHSIKGSQHAWQIAFLRQHDPADCLKKFKANGWLGLLLTAAIIAGHPG